MKEFFLNIGINMGLTVSGLLGSLLLIGKQKGKSLREQIISVFGGTMSANYLTPMVIDLTGVDTASVQYGFAFIIGFSGLKIVEFLTEKYLSKIKTDKDGEDAVSN
jgi:hypothetical protein